MDEKFIECVKKFPTPCLWDTQNVHYKCNETNDAAWEIIMKEMNISDIKTAKAKWKKLRDNHRDALKRQNQTRSGQAAKQTREWRYQKIMEFLLPHMQNRARSSNFTTTNSGFPLRSPNRDNDAIDSAQIDLNDDLEVFDFDSIAASNISVSTLPANQSSVTSCPDFSKRNKKRKCEEISDFLIQHTVSRKQREEEREELKKIIMAPESLDDMDHFFVTIAKSIKKLPSFLQVRVKRKAMNALLEAEEENETSSWDASYSTAGTETGTSQNNENNVGIQTSQETSESIPFKNDANESIF